jgi:hypothetical protein
MNSTMIEQSQSAFVQLGKLMCHLGAAHPWPGFECGITEAEYEEFEELIKVVPQHNRWFSEENIRMAIGNLGCMLEEEGLRAWRESYPEAPEVPKRIGLIMAGNIPLVGFHDVLCVVLAGHKAAIKLSSDDKLLLPAITRLLEKFDPSLQGKIEFSEGKLTNYDAVIATGSNNTARYFDYYFKHVPLLVRKNRNSVAVLTGEESPEELARLGHDIFDFFGLGCRNVTKVYVPRDFLLDRFFEAIYPFHAVGDHNKYANNYDYHKAIWLLNGEEILDNGFILLKEDPNLSSPTGTLYYERYDQLSDVTTKLKEQQEDIQCIVGRDYLPFGQAQKPGLADYADGVDTMEWVLRSV